MSPIKGLSEVRRLPRLGKIHLGVKVEKTNDKGEVVSTYPRATDYFVCPPEVQAVYGEKPQKLDIIIPIEDDEVWANQYYRQYSRSRGLVCKGDGETCRRMVDATTGDTANRDSKTVSWKEGLSCPGKACLDYQRKACQEVMNLQFLLPRVPGLGVWQVDTGSVNSILNINSEATMIRSICGRVNWIPLVLTLEPTEVTNPEDGKKKVVRCLHLRHEAGLQELLAATNKARVELLVAGPVEDEAPSDTNGEVVEGQAQEVSIERAKTDIEDERAKTDIEELWGYGAAQDAPIKASAPKPPTITRDFVLGQVIVNKGYRTPANALDYLRTRHKVTEERLNAEPEKVWDEVKKLEGWA